MNNIIKNLFYLFLPIILGSLIGIIIAPYIDYTTLVKPILSPPGYLFPIIWSIIYLLMGISFYLYKKNAKNCYSLEKYYYVQLIVNILWSVFFFIFKWRLFTILWTILLLFLVIKLFILYLKRYKLSAYLNIFYLIWLLFATYLTIGIYILNI